VNTTHDYDTIVVGASLLFPLAKGIEEELELARYGVEFIDLPIMASNLNSKTSPPAISYSNPLRMALYVLRHFGAGAMLGFVRLMAFCKYPASLMDRFPPRSLPRTLDELLASAPCLVYTFAQNEGGGLMRRVKGGMGSLSEALCRSIADKDGEVRFKTPVRRIVIEGGRAMGVELRDGRRITARAVLSNLDKPATFFGLVATGRTGVFLSAAMRLTGLGGGIVPPEAGFYPSPGAQPRFDSRSRSR